MASFLDIFDVVDSDGAGATRYRLHYLGSSLSNQDSWIFGMLTELVYALFQIMVIPANALLGAVLNTGEWMDPLAEFYRKVTAPLYAVFPPWAIACLGLALVAVSELRARPAKIQSSETFNRIGGALAMAAMVLALTSNPIALVAKLLELANGFAVGLAAAVTGSGNDSLLSSSQALVDASIRTPTIALNYGGEMSATCRTQWSQAMMANEPLGQDTGCFAAGSNAAGVGSLSTAVLMLILPALPMLVFCVIAAWKYFVHLTFAVVWLLASGWVAAVSIWGNRGFDKLAMTFARSLAHLLIAVLTSMLAVALPATCAGLGVNLLGLVTNTSAQPYVLMVSLGVGFAISAWAIWKLTSTHSTLVRILNADVRTSLDAINGDKPTRLTFKNMGAWVAEGKLPDEKKKPGDTKGGPNQGGPGKNTPGGQKTALAADPAAVARRVGQKPSESKESDSVDHLIAAAQQVAGVSATSSSEPAGSPVAAVVVSSIPSDTPTAVPDPPAARPADRGTAPEPQSPQPASTAVPNGSDPYGHFSDSPAPVDIPASTVNTDNGSTEDSTDSPLGNPAVSLVNSDPVAVPAGGEIPSSGSVLADPPRAAVAGETGAPPVVPGLRGADSEVEAVSSATGAVFVTAEKPESQRWFSPLLRRFARSAPNADPPGGVPGVAYGPALGADAPPAPTAPAADPGLAPGVVGPVVNDQQRWNQLKQVRDFVQRRGSSAARMVPDTLSGTGTRPHPGSFQAPIADFLADGELMSQIEQVKAVFGAGGTPVEIRIDPNDRRVGLQLSSDPDERLRPSTPPGFGDPV